MSKEFYICYHSETQTAFLYSFKADDHNYLMQWVEHPLEATAFTSLKEAEEMAQQLLEGNPQYQRFFVGSLMKNKTTCQFSSILEVFLGEVENE